MQSQISMTTRAADKLHFIVTCEHASAEIPTAERSWLKIPSVVLNSHMAWDLGAENVAQKMSELLQTKLISGTHTRLLCDLNRTSDNKNVFSKFSNSLSPDEKQRLIQTYHQPHWIKVNKAVSKLIHQGQRVIHLGIHSFTPIYEGVERPTDLGLLYDPSRDLERSLALKWQKDLRRQVAFRIDLNRPYRGTGNGLVSDFRNQFSSRHYLGFEIELNQKGLRSQQKREFWAEQLASSLQRVINN